MPKTLNTFAACQHRAKKLGRELSRRSSSTFVRDSETGRIYRYYLAPAAHAQLMSSEGNSALDVFRMNRQRLLVLIAGLLIVAGF